MIPEIQARIDRKLAELQATPDGGDPAIAPWASAIAAQVRRAQAFEGAIIAETIPAVLAQAPHLTVLAQPRIALPNRAIEHADRNVKIDVEFDGSGRERKLDTLVFDHVTGVVEIAEVKRGWRPIGADHKRNRKRDDAALRLVGLSYARRRLRVEATQCHTAVISYYGRTGLPENMTVRADELDAHYRWPVRRVVEEHLQYFRHHLDWAIPGLTGQGD